MKYLKINARHPECHGLARALIGSPVVDDDCNGIRRLSAIEESRGDWSFGCFYPEGKFFGCTFWEQTILLPLDTLKLCPFVCMREGVGFKYELGFCADRSPMFSRTGLFSDIDKISWTIKGLERVTLDLDNLPKGAEIVEAE